MMHAPEAATNTAEIVEHIVEPAGHVPKIVPQKRVSHGTVELFVDMHMPITVEKAVHVQCCDPFEVRKAALYEAQCALTDALKAQLAQSCRQRSDDEINKWNRIVTELKLKLPEIDFESDDDDDRKKRRGKRNRRRKKR